MKKLVSVSILAMTTAWAVVGCAAQRDAQKSDEAKLTPIPENQVPPAVAPERRNSQTLEVDPNVIAPSSAPVETLPPDEPFMGTPDSHQHPAPKNSLP